MKTINTTTAVLAVMFFAIAFTGGFFLGRMSAVNNFSKSPSADSRDKNKGSFSSSTPSAEKSIDYSGVLEQLQSRLKDNPDNATFQARIGDKYFDMKRYNDSIPYYQKAIELDPGDIDSYNDLGLVFYYLDDPGEGLKYLEEGIKTNPNYQRIWLTKGFILAFGLKDLEKARAAWEKTRSIDPESEIAKAAMDFISRIKDTK